MKGGEFVASLPSDLAAAQPEIIAAVRDGHALPIRWSAIETRHGDHVGQVWVAEDALSIGETDDFVRVNVSHRSAQRLADLLDARLPTTRISDLAFAHAAVKLKPVTKGAPRGTKGAMTYHHRAVETQRAGRTGLVRTVGKDWVLTNDLFGTRGRGATFGWHSAGAAARSPGGAAVIQRVNLDHSDTYTDYSQVLCLVRKSMMVDGVERLLDEVLQSPALAPLVSDEGPLKLIRHPDLQLRQEGVA